MLKIVQRSRDLRLDLAGGSQLQATDVEHVPSMPKVEALCQLEHYRKKSIDWSFSYLAAGTCDSVEPKVQAAS